MKRSRTILMLAAAAAIAAGCNGDIGKQIASNEVMRTQVFDALATNPQLAMQAIDRVVQPDTLRQQVVAHLLANDEVAKLVLVRIGTNPEALDMVVGIAAKDSAMRGHLVTLVKGIEMASK